MVQAESVASLKIETFGMPDPFVATHSLNRCTTIWPKTIKVYCTAINEVAGLDDYLRPLDAVVAFESGEREGEKALAAFFGGPSGSGHSAASLYREHDALAEGLQLPARGFAAERCRSCSGESPDLHGRHQI